MFTILNNQKNSFHYHPLNIVTTDYYIVDVSVSEIQHNTVDIQYWKVNYSFQFVPYSPQSKKDFDVQLQHHPFYNSTVEDYQFYYEDYYDKLPLTSIIVDHLMLNDEQIATVCGKLTIHEYRKQLMWTLLNW